MSSRLVNSTQSFSASTNPLAYAQAFSASTVRRDAEGRPQRSRRRGLSLHAHRTGRPAK